MSNAANLCQTCWAEGQRPGKPCWLCHSVAKEARADVSASSKDEGLAGEKDDPYVASVVKEVPMDAIILEADPDNPYAPPSVVESSNTYKASSILLAVLLVVVCVVLSVNAPGLGIPVSVILLPALIRTVVATNKQSAKGKPATLLATLSMFLFSAAAAIAAAVAAAIACVAALLSACLVVCFGAQANVVEFNDEVFIVIVGVSIAAAVASGIYLFIQLIKSTS